MRNLAFGALVALLFELLTCETALAQAENVRRGGTITIAASSTPQSLLSQVDTGANVFGLATKYLETLVKVDEKGEFKPVLATAWEMSTDGKTWTFVLRSGVKWHDGKQFAAADVKWNVENVWRKVWAVQAIEVVASVEALEDRVVIRLSKPISPDVFLAFFATRAHILAPHGFVDTTLTTSAQNQMPIGTGPFKVTEHVRRQHVIMDRNPDYWDAGRPYLDRIVWRFIDDQNTRTAAFYAGEIDLVPMSALPLTEIEAARSNPKFAVSSKGYEQHLWYTGLVFNILNPTLQNPSVRHAIAHAIDKRKIVDLAFLGSARPMDGALPEGARYFARDLPRYEFDPAKANRLLDQAGFPAAGMACASR
jgi:peptide/nickel transport system substrate-binding protein